MVHGREIMGGFHGTQRLQWKHSLCTWRRCLFEFFLIIIYFSTYRAMFREHVGNYYDPVWDWSVTIILRLECDYHTAIGVWLSYCDWSVTIILRLECDYHTAIGVWLLYCDWSVTIILWLVDVVSLWFVTVDRYQQTGRAGLGSGSSVSHADFRRKRWNVRQTSPGFADWAASWESDETH